jgi:F420-0:gamma-glutamyl ligase-like protein
MSTPDMSSFRPNRGKKLIVDTDFGRYARYPVKTHVVVKGDNLKDIMDKYVMPYIVEGDRIFLSEKIVAISQGRAFHIDDIKPSWLARFLVKFVTKSPHGIGLGSPYTMELAIRDCGVPIILWGCICAAVTKPFGIKGVFYNVVGTRARAIDGPCEYTLPPYNNYAKMAPLEPDKVCKELAEHIGCDVVMLDANDLGVEVLGKSTNAVTLQMARQIFRDNPLDQSDQQTPIAIAREVPDDMEEPVFEDASVKEEKTEE